MNNPSPINLKPWPACLLALAFACQSPSEADYDTAYVEEEPDPIYAEHVRTTGFQTPEQEMADFILPPGFEVTLFASEPEISKPINMAFDDRGRLWVTQSSEYPIKAGPGEGTDRISILEDSNGDGTADKITHFAEDLNIPIGIIPVQGGAIAYSIPNVYRFFDANGDGRSERREVLIADFEHRDTHGMVNNLFRGLDGWIHASHGFSNISTVSGTDGDSITMTSGNTFRFRMDGSRVEKTTDGRINPFGSDLDEWGYHYSADCHTLPIYQLIWGGNYTQWGKKDPNMGFAPTMMDYGLNSTALSGLVYYTDNQFPEEYQNSFYSGDVVTCRISRSVMEFKGSTPWATRKRDFLVSKDPWFRPVDIKIGPDGAMYVADFYNPIIGHYEVPLDHPDRDRNSGRIWKITYKGNKRTAKDWSKAALAEILEEMGNPILHTRLAATDALVDYHGTKAVSDLNDRLTNEKTSPSHRVQVLWALFRLGSLQEGTLKAALYHEEPLVRVHAYRIFANLEQWDEEQRGWALDGLSDKDPHVRRAAGEAVNRHPHAAFYKALVQAHQLADPEDTHLIYTLKMALFTHMHDPAMIRMAADEAWPEEQAALLALVISDTSSPEAGSYLFDYLKYRKVPEHSWLGYVRSVSRSIPENQLRDAVAFSIEKSRETTITPHKWALALQDGIQQRGMDAPNYLISWIKELSSQTLARLDQETENWSAEKEEKYQFAVSASGRYRFAAHTESLKTLVRAEEVPESLRGEAALALVRILPSAHMSFLSELMKDSDQKTSFRLRLANTLGQSASPEARTLLAAGLKDSPIELQTAIAAQLARSGPGKSLLIMHIREGHAPARILKARNVEEAFRNQANTSQQEAFEFLTANIRPISEEREQLIGKRIEGFEGGEQALVSGKQLFDENCGLCHQVNKQGGMIGPQLDGVGNWGIHALATKILDPNRNISENFRTYNFRLTNGEVKSGLFRREEGQVIVLADQNGQEFSISKNDVREQTASNITLMPDTFSESLDQEKFNSLMAYLLSVK
ncbi:MAG: c-type cytochrome [Lunatimonas sp.]|uniref:PVC-type heme-binding CxxCH protein n=1 Tax=Lunatimonas sp. TaxID=2060141 RepID=UPI00263B0D09|nr:PVC-type heme-binding CxxCH protein [Lunatimonas sp.]MCC5936586.1 c-type cytochrome [Lunatimonas sp.]